MPITDSMADREISSFAELDHDDVSGATAPTRYARGWVVAAVPILIWTVTGLPVLWSNLGAVFTIEDQDVPAVITTDLEQGLRYTIVLESQDAFVSSPFRDDFEVTVRDPDGREVDVTDGTRWYRIPMLATTYYGDFKVETTGRYKVVVRSKDGALARASLQPDINSRPDAAAMLQFTGSVAAAVSFVVLFRRWRRRRRPTRANVRT